MCLGGTPERGWEQGGLPELCPEDKRRSYSPWRTGWEAQDKGDPSPLELTPLGGVVSHLADNNPMMCGSESLAQPSASRRSITLTVLGLLCSMKWGGRMAKFSWWCSFNLSLSWKPRAPSQGSSKSMFPSLNLQTPKAAMLSWCGQRVESGGHLRCLNEKPL